MTKKKYIIPSLLAMCLAGCATYLPNDRLSFIMKQAPLVPCNELSRSHGRTEREGVPFTGRTIRYQWGFELVLYENGRQVPERRIPYGVTTHFLPDQKTHDAIFRAAFREYARSDMGFAHNEYVICFQDGYGEIEDVPKLIKGLEYWGDITSGDPVACSRDHCLEALEFVTGAKPGLNASDWQKWWDQYKAKRKD